MFGDYEKAIKILTRLGDDANKLLVAITDNETSSSNAKGTCRYLLERMHCISDCIAELRLAWKVEEREFAIAYSASMDGRTIDEYIDECPLDVLVEWNKTHREV